MKEVNLMLGNCLETLKNLPDNSVDSIVTDPPYGISFMGKKWDYDVPSVEIWKECYRVLKAGGHILAFAGTRTQHRMAINIEDAGFEIRDMLAWVYGSGFPKSLNISKAIDKKGGNLGLSKQIGEELKKARLKRKISLKKADEMFCNGTTNYNWFEGRKDGQRIPDEETFIEIANEWEELKELQLKVAEAEREVIGTRKSNAMDAQNWLGEKYDGHKSNEIDITKPATTEAIKYEGWGTALKPALEPITLARKPLDEKTIAANVLKHGTGGINIDGCRIEDGKRFPANFIHDGSDENLELLDKAERYFYCPKTNKTDRNEGLDEFESIKCGTGALRDNGRGKIAKNNHPTVKPTDLMRYLCRLITPVDGVVLDPFMGSGSTGKAAVLEGFDFIGCEMDEDYIKIAQARIDFVNKD